MSKPEFVKMIRELSDRRLLELVAFMLYVNFSTSNQIEVSELARALAGGQ